MSVKNTANRYATAFTDSFSFKWTFAFFGIGMALAFSSLSAALLVEQFGSMSVAETDEWVRTTFYIAAFGVLMPFLPFVEGVWGMVTEYFGWSDTNE